MEQIIIQSEEGSETNGHQDQTFENEKNYEMLGNENENENENVDVNDVLIAVQWLAQAITNQNEWPMEKMIISIRRFREND